ncbi:MAG TPA: hypothetical protein VJT31_39150 [Rugosimonospora sp.]|nr:hypothetical protein [Rugosimonospora sp.]
MEFSEAQLQSVGDQIASWLNWLTEKVNGLGALAQQAIDRLPAAWQNVKDAIARVVRQIIQALTDFLKKAANWATELAVPVRCWKRSRVWEQVIGQASAIAGELRPELLGTARHWPGTASATYVASIKPQADAAQRVSSTAEKASGNLVLAAAAGLVFYSVLLGALVNLAGSMGLLPEALFTGPAAPVTLEAILAAMWAFIKVAGAAAGTLEVALYKLSRELDIELLKVDGFEHGDWPVPRVA